MDIVVLPGDGIGPEITEATLAVLRAADARFALGLAFETHAAGLATLKTRGTTLPEEVFSRAMAADGTILGPISSFEYPPREQGGINLSAAFRTRGELYANIRPARSRAGLPHWGRTPMDLVIVRENTEGLYAGRERREDDRAIAERLITRRASERIARTAFEIAVQRAAQRQPAGARVTIVHKANVLKETDGLFRETVLEVARAYPTIAVDELLVDAAALRLVRDPESFDVLVTTNLFGDILSDEAAGLVGGLGIAPSGNVGETAAVFEPVHGSAPDIAGKGIANPVAAILAGALMLDHIGLAAEADRLRVAVDATLDDGVRTPDLGGTASTDQVVQAIIDHLAAPPAPGTHVGTRVL